ncbi:helix-turn-helix transcriptional regulator [Maricaulis sp.]|uniref:S24 family peptidase n=1 Tax=Maricaulis sp. TaxID=1486257 RepID=UPI0026164B4E|nr:helix-turn-helix transcriptional regulator [Maricaulis sp.]
MFTHDEIWRGIDRLAAHAQTSPSGLARRAGLDSTTFNPSKRFSRDGSKPRWPSTESLAKALSAAHMDFAGFADLVAGKTPGRALQARALADSPDTAFDAGGLPRGEGWTRIPFPGLSLDNAYALTVEGDGMKPVYRHGDRLVVAPDDPLRPGDRVVVKRRDGTTEAWELGERSVQAVSLIALNPRRPDCRVKLTEIAWMARIVWASQ